MSEEADSTNGTFVDSIGIPMRPEIVAIVTESLLTYASSSPRKVSNTPPRFWGSPGAGKGGEGRKKGGKKGRKKGEGGKRGEKKKKEKERNKMRTWPGSEE